MIRIKIWHTGLNKNIPNTQTDKRDMAKEISKKFESVFEEDSW